MGYAPYSMKKLNKLDFGVKTMAGDFDESIDETRTSPKRDNGVDSTLAEALRRQNQAKAKKPTDGQPEADHTSSKAHWLKDFIVKFLKALLVTPFKVTAGVIRKAATRLTGVSWEAKAKQGKQDLEDIGEMQERLDAKFSKSMRDHQQELSRMHLSKEHLMSDLTKQQVALAEQRHKLKSEEKASPSSYYKAVSDDAHGQTDDTPMVRTALGLPGPDASNHKPGPTPVKQQISAPSAKKELTEEEKEKLNNLVLSAFDCVQHKTVDPKLTNITYWQGFGGQVTSMVSNLRCEREEYWESTAKQFKEETANDSVTPDLRDRFAGVLFEIACVMDARKLQAASESGNEKSFHVLLAKNAVIARAGFDWLNIRPSVVTELHQQLKEGSELSDTFLHWSPDEAKYPIEELKETYEGWGPELISWNSRSGRDTSCQVEHSLGDTSVYISHSRPENTRDGLDAKNDNEDVVNYEEEPVDETDRDDSARNKHVSQVSDDVSPPSWVDPTNGMAR